LPSVYLVLKAIALKQQISKFYPLILGTEASHHIYFSQHPVILLDRHSRIHCLIICDIQLSTSSNLGGTWRCICLLHIRSVSALDVVT